MGFFNIIKSIGHFGGNDIKKLGEFGGAALNKIGHLKKHLGSCQWSDKWYIRKMCRRNPCYRWCPKRCRSLPRPQRINWDAH